MNDNVNSFCFVEQDRGLEALSEVISRQKNLAQVIGNEVTYQNELIDDITDHVDRTRDRLVGQTNNVRTIDRKDSTGSKSITIVFFPKLKIFQY